MPRYPRTSDFERNKLGKQLLSDTPFPGLLDPSRPIIVVSEDAIRMRKTTALSEMMKVNGWPLRRIQIVTLKKLDDLPEFQTTPDERERFGRGEPLLFRVGAFGLRPDRSSGGQVTDDIEKQINDAFAVNVFVMVERLRRLVPLRDGKKRRNWSNQEAARDFIFDKEALPLPWPEGDYRTTGTDRRRLLDTAWRNGQRPECLGCLYPSSARLLREEIADWAKRFHGQRKDVIAKEYAS